MGQFPISVLSGSKVPGELGGISFKELQSL